MNDYYAVLGISRNAEDVVIKAAYKALAQRYHPDKFQGPKETANKKMREINEAYEVLGNPKKRKQYDDTSSNTGEEGNTFNDEDTGEESKYDPLEKDWELAVFHYPDLADLSAKLNSISWKISYIYRATLLETKRFDSRVMLAAEIKRNYLSKYFGENSDIQDFAVHLIVTKNKEVANFLNKSVKLLGDKIDAFGVISKICKQFNIQFRYYNQVQEEFVAPGHPWMLYAIGGIAAIMFIVFFLIVISQYSP